MKRTIPVAWRGERLFVVPKPETPTWKYRAALAVAIVEGILLALFVVIPEIWRQILNGS